MRTPAPKILITGATGKIGRVLSLELSAHGAALALHYNNSKAMAEDLAREIGDGGVPVHVIGADLKDEKSAHKFIEHAVKLLGGLDVLIHTAAIFDKTPFEEVTQKQFEKILAVDLIAPFFLAQAAASYMKNGGQMIFFSDVSASRPYVGYAPYSIAKQGVETLVKALARELAPKIRVNAIAPYVMTRPKDMTDKGWRDLLNKTPLARPTSPREIANLVKTLVWGVSTMTGQIICIDSGRLLK